MNGNTKSNTPSTTTTTLLSNPDQERIKARVEAELNLLDIDYLDSSFKPSRLIRARLVQAQGTVDLSVPGLAKPDTTGYNIILRKVGEDTEPQ
jgi:hypothetical protein